MNICFEGAKVGTICLGDALGALHGEQIGTGHAGLAILATVAIAVAVFILRDPA